MPPFAIPSAQVGIGMYFLIGFAACVVVVSSILDANEYLVTDAILAGHVFVDGLVRSQLSCPLSIFDVRRTLYQVFQLVHSFLSTPHATVCCCRGSRKARSATRFNQIPKYFTFLIDEAPPTKPVGDTY